MTLKEPAAELNPRYSNPSALPTPWSEARRTLADAEVYWLSTVRTDGQPNVTPLVGVWLDDCFAFCTGDDEQKARNLTRNARCTVSTGTNTLHGMDIVVEGDALVVSDDALLERLAAAFCAKYGAPFDFTAAELRGSDGHIAYQLTPKKGFAFSKGEPFSQTRWRFSQPPGGPT